MPRRWRSSAVYSALVVIGMGLVVTSDGSPLWRVVRLLAVAIVCVAVARSPATRNMRAVALVAFGTISAPVGATIAFSYLTTTGPFGSGLASRAGDPGCSRSRLRRRRLVVGRGVRDERAEAESGQGHAGRSRIDVGRCDSCDQRQGHVVRLVRPVAKQSSSRAGARVLVHAFERARTSGRARSAGLRRAPVRCARPWTQWRAGDGSRVVRRSRHLRCCRLSRGPHGCRS